MIDYAVLCKAIEEWKSGRPASAAPAPPRPAIPTPARRAPVEEPEEVVEYSGLYESAEAPAEPQESTVIYQLPDYDNVEVADDEQ